MSLWQVLLLLLLLLFHESIYISSAYLFCLIVTLPLLPLSLIRILSFSHRVLKFHYEMKCIQSGRQERMARRMDARQPGQKSPEAVCTRVHACARVCIFAYLFKIAIRARKLFFWRCVFACVFVCQHVVACVRFLSHIFPLFIHVMLSGTHTMRLHTLTHTHSLITCQPVRPHLTCSLNLKQGVYIYIYIYIYLCKWIHNKQKRN